LVEVRKILGKLFKVSEKRKKFLTFRDWSFTLVLATAIPGYFCYELLSATGGKEIDKEVKKAMNQGNS
jgi:hypothetical protein